MKKSNRNVSLALATLLALLLSTPEVGFAHGGKYKGKPSTIGVPTCIGVVSPYANGDPPSRTPSDPPTNGDHGGGGTGQPNIPGVTPQPAAPGLGGGPRVGPRAGAGGSYGGRAGATTPGQRRRAASKAPGFERWELWWSLNGASILNLEDRLAQRKQDTGYSDWLLGDRDRSEIKIATRPGPVAIRDRVVPALIERLGDPFFDVRAAAVIALAKAGDAGAIPHLTKTLRDTHKQVSESAALALGILGESAGIDPLLALVNDTREGRELVGRPQGVPVRTRAFAALGLGMIGDSRATAKVVRLIDPRHKEESRDVPACAALALGILGPVAADAVPTLIEHIRNPRTHEVVRTHAVTALGKIGEPNALPFLRQLLRDRSTHVRRSAILALGELAEPGDDLTEKFLLQVAVKNSRDLQARNWALITLGAIGGGASEKMLKQTVTEGNGTEQSFAAISLAIYAKRNNQQSTTAPYLRKGLRDVRDASTRGAFCIALGIIEDKESIRSLQAIFSGKGAADLRGYAALALGMTRASESIPMLRAALDSAGRDPEFQRTAATALGLLGDRFAVETLTNLIRNAKSEYVMASAAMALGRIADHTAIDLLAGLAADRAGTSDLARANATVALGLLAENSRQAVLRKISVGTNYRALVDALQEALTIS